MFWTIVTELNTISPSQNSRLKILDQRFPKAKTKNPRYILVVAVLPKIDQFLNLIEDGEWHNLQELAKRSNIPKQKLTALSKLLSQSNILEYQPQKDEVRLEQEWRQMLNDTCEQSSEKLAVGTIVLPPKKSLEIQGIQVTNLTDKELEIGVRVDEKLRELAVAILD